MKVVNELLKEVRVLKIEAKEREENNRELKKKLIMIFEVVTGWIKEIK